MKAWPLNFSPLRSQLRDYCILNIDLNQPLWSVTRPDQKCCMPTTLLAPNEPRLDAIIMGVLQQHLVANRLAAWPLSSAPIVDCRRSAANRQRSSGQAAIPHQLVWRCYYRDCYYAARLMSQSFSHLLLSCPVRPCAPKTVGRRLCIQAPRVPGGGGG